MSETSASTMRKLLIVPYFGKLPSWYYHWEQNTRALYKYGYTVAVISDTEYVRRLISTKLGLDVPLLPGGTKIHDLRCTFGVLFEDLTRSFDFWGHTDLDCVYGNLGKWLSDDFLSDIDIFSNHPTYVSGPFSLYRNEPVVNNLFAAVSGWESFVTAHLTTGWVETAYSEFVDRAAQAGLLRKVYANFQTQDWNDFSTLHFDGDGLFEGDTEVMMAHFRRTKTYPERCK